MSMSRSLTLKHIRGGKPGHVFYPLQVKELPRPLPGPHELLIRLSAAALNRRDLFVRQRLYPGISLSSPLLSDGCGTVIALGAAVTRTNLLHKSVLLTPMRGWESQPTGPENPLEFGVVGSSTSCEGVGTAQEYMVVGESEVELAPEHLSPAEGAALPLAGLTGWRALVTKSNAAFPGSNILITGIGGGVALQVLQFGVAFGSNVFVTSGDETKIRRAVQLGARGGVNYKSNAWDRDLAALLPKDRPYLDAVIDGSGGDLVGKTVRLLKPGGIISQYGMTISPKMDWLMQAVLANVELRGTSIGSRQEFRDMVAFVREKRIRPVVSRTVKGLTNLEGIEGLFEDLKGGKQFGKLVIEIEEGPSAKL